MAVMRSASARWAGDDRTTRRALDALGGDLVIEEHGGSVVPGVPGVSRQEGSGP